VGALTPPAGLRPTFPTHAQAPADNHPSLSTPPPPLHNVPPIGAPCYTPHRSREHVTPDRRQAGPACSTGASAGGGAPHPASLSPSSSGTLRVQPARWRRPQAHTCVRTRRREEVPGRRPRGTPHRAGVAGERRLEGEWPGRHRGWGGGHGAAVTGARVGGGRVGGAASDGAARQWGRGEKWRGTWRRRGTVDEAGVGGVHAWATFQRIKHRAVTTVRSQLPRRGRRMRPPSRRRPRSSYKASGEKVNKRQLF